MTRPGFNSDWQWKQWAAEIKACKEAISRGNLAEADAHLKIAEALDDQLELDLAGIDEQLEGP